MPRALILTGIIFGPTIHTCILLKCFFTNYRYVCTIYYFLQWETFHQLHDYTVSVEVNWSGDWEVSIVESLERERGRERD